MTSVLTVPETELGVGPKKCFSWDGYTVNDTESNPSEDLRQVAGHLPTSCTSHVTASTAGVHATSQDAGIPQSVTKRLLELLPADSRRSLRLTCKAWSREIDRVMPFSRPTANTIPAEILLQIFLLLSPRDFDNARRTCSQWMRVSLNEALLESMLKRAGWWDSWQRDCRNRRPSSIGARVESLVWRMSRRFATECVLSGRKMNVEKPGFLTTTVVDFSQLSQKGPEETSTPSTVAMQIDGTNTDALNMSMFHVSNCGNYLLVSSACNIYVYRLLTRVAGNSLSSSFGGLQNTDIVPVATITCPVEVVSVTIDTSSPTFVVAALLCDRLGLVCDLVPCISDSDPTGSHGSATRGAKPMKLGSVHYYHDLGCAEDPPRSVSVCPGRRCVAYGSGAGIELHWIDDKTKQSCRKHFPLSQPSEILHFLPNRDATSTEVRLISSLAEAAGCKCHPLQSGNDWPTCPFHLMTDIQSFTQLPRGESGNLSLIRATHCHHYRAIPVNDGLHMLFIEPRTNSLCIGSDAPIGGPTSLTRALICVPPFGKDPLDAAKGGSVPSVFTAGSDLSWGLRVVAAYGDRLVLYSVPLDVFNVIRKERERQGDNVMGDSDLARDWFLDSQRPRKRRESLVPNQNGDWEFLLSVSYRPTAMMWPLKIYGKEIGQMDNVVELALQASHGGARVWAFCASGETSIIDVDTFTSNAQPVAGIPCKSLSIGSDGRVASTQLIARSESGSLSTRSSQKRKPEEFGGKHLTACRLHQHFLDRYNLTGISSSAQAVAASAAARRRASFAACIVDFNIPELSTRRDQWEDSVS
ncbi:hypothetical protein EYZ11_005940 [Aspergillus tanneri]|uniref:F-box domain-containing protein n=1 Tax=Aspergillus tanneri TaxID=1220188 RepID=A0A4S3JH51_9EURO|nr:uncharacterized protein ATNIH1004_010420 [Aspergillus tanneri]KAA8643651.1 hypothetical protein ATNIH1004_010420 [Aspergillus tanneri]THC94580.1 hypothetical protein EYZ11_005940 [Aspergillus tanneri]